MTVPLTAWAMGRNLHSDTPRDRCHGLNQSATRISGPDFTIMPAYCVVCRMRAITPSYKGDKYAILTEY